MAGRTTDMESELSRLLAFRMRPLCHSKVARISYLSRRVITRVMAESSICVIPPPRRPVPSSLPFLVAHGLPWLHPPGACPPALECCHGQARAAAAERARGGEGLASRTPFVKEALPRRNQGDHDQVTRQGERSKWRVKSEKGNERREKQAGRETEKDGDIERQRERRRRRRRE